MTRQQRRNLRNTALVLVSAWFLYWGEAAFSGSRARDVAEQAEIEAERRNDWTSAEVYARDRHVATLALIHAIGWGFLFPLALLVASEIHAGILRMKRRGEQ